MQENTEYAIRGSASVDVDDMIFRDEDSYVSDR